jgi:hypothetical protein
MIGEFDIYGVYFPLFIVVAFIAFALHLGVRRLLDSLGVYRFVWHRPLFDLSLYVIMLGAVTALGAIVFPTI